jgi:multicomponent Na+:H+ antiporter subunit E
MYAVRAVLLLTAVYLALTANLSISNIIAGLVLAVIVLLLIRPSGSDVDWRHLPVTLGALFKYLVVLAFDLIISGLQMTRLVLNPSLPLKQGIVAIPTESESETAAALSAHAITITPGELVVEMDEEGTFYTHVLDTSHAQEDVKKAQEMREQLLQKIFP